MVDELPVKLPTLKLFPGVVIAETSNDPFKFKLAPSESNPVESTIHVIPVLIVIVEGLLAPFILKLPVAPLKVKVPVALKVLLKLNNGTPPEVEGSLNVLLLTPLYVKLRFGSPVIVSVGVFKAELVFQGFSPLSVIVVLPALAAVGNLIVFAVAVAALNSILPNVIIFAFSISKIPLLKAIVADGAVNVPPEPTIILVLVMFIAVAADADKVLLELMVRVLLTFIVVKFTNEKPADGIVQTAFNVQVAPLVLPCNVQLLPLIVKLLTAPETKLSIGCTLVAKGGMVIVLAVIDELVKRICGLPVIVTEGAPDTEIALAAVNVSVSPALFKKFIVFAVPVKVILANDKDDDAPDKLKMQLFKVTGAVEVKIELTIKLTLFKDKEVAAPVLPITVQPAPVIVPAPVPVPVIVYVPPAIVPEKLKIGLFVAVTGPNVIVLELDDTLVKEIYGVPVILTVPAVYVQGLTAFNVILVPTTGNIKAFVPEVNVILPSDIAALPTFSSIALVATSKVAPTIDKDAVPETVTPAVSIIQVTPFIVRPEEVRVPFKVKLPLPVKVKAPVPLLPEKLKIGFVPDTALRVTVLAEEAVPV